MRYIDLSKVQKKTGGRSRSSIYRDVDSSRLPPPIKFGGRLYWIEDEVDAALEAARK